MRLVIILILLSLSASAQVQYIGGTATTVINRGAFISDSVMILPKRDTTAAYAAQRLFGRLTMGLDSSMYFHNGTKWLEISSTASHDSLVPYSGAVANVRLGYKTITAAKHIGTDTTDDGGTTSAAFSVQRTLSSSVNANGHGYKDNTAFNRSGYSYNSYDALPTMTVTNSDHIVSFQSRFTLSPSGTVNHAYGFWSEPTFSGTGTITNNYGVYLANPTGGGSTVTNNYGLYVVAQSKGSTLNRAIYTAGSTPSYLGGNLYLNGSLGVGKADGASLTQALDVTGGIAFTQDLRGDGDNFYYNATTNSMSIGTTTSAGTSYSIRTANQIRSEIAMFAGSSNGSYNAYYINGLGGNFGTIQRTSSNNFSLGWDTNIGERLGTAVLTWNTSSKVMIATTTDNTRDELQVAGSIQGTGWVQAVTNKTADYTATGTDHTITVDATGGNVTITLPTSGVTTGQIYNIKLISATNSAILDPATGTIDGAATLTISTQYENKQVQFDGTNYIVL